MNGIGFDTLEGFSVARAGNVRQDIDAASGDLTLVSKSDSEIILERTEKWSAADRWFAYYEDELGNRLYNPFYHTYQN